MCPLPGFPGVWGGRKPQSPLGSPAAQRDAFRSSASPRAQAKGKGQSSELPHGHRGTAVSACPWHRGRGRAGGGSGTLPARELRDCGGSPVLRLHLARSQAGRQAAGPPSPTVPWPAGRGKGDPARPGRLGSGAGESALGTGEASPSTGQGPLRESRSPPAVPSHPVRDRSIPASHPRATSIASCLTLRLWSCRDSGVKFAEPSLFRCPHCEGWGPLPSPQTPPGAGSDPGRTPGVRGHGWGAAAPPTPSAPGSSPPPAAALAAACSSRALGQRRRQLPEPETMLLRHPHAVPSNALQREDGRREKGSEEAEGRAVLLQRREGPGRRGLAQGPGGAAHRPPRDPSLPPPPQSERPGPGSPGREPLPRPAQAQPPRPLSFVCSEAGLGSGRPRWSERGFGM